MTQAGMILGAAAYMSPEQARGRATDKRVIGVMVGGGEACRTDQRGRQLVRRAEAPRADGVMNGRCQM